MNQGHAPGPQSNSAPLSGKGLQVHLCIYLSRTCHLPNNPWLYPRIPFPFQAGYPALPLERAPRAQMSSEGGSSCPTEPPADLVPRGKDLALLTLSTKQLATATGSLLQLSRSLRSWLGEGEWLSDWDHLRPTQLPTHHAPAHLLVPRYTISPGVMPKGRVLLLLKRALPREATTESIQHHCKDGEKKAHMLSKRKREGTPVPTSGEDIVPLQAEGVKHNSRD